MRPILAYASPVWGYAAKTNINILDTLQNSLIRMIIKATRYMRNDHIPPGQPIGVNVHCTLHPIREQPLSSQPSQKTLKTHHPDEEHKPRLPDSIAQPITNMPLSRMENTTFTKPSIIDSHDMGLRTVYSPDAQKKMPIQQRIADVSCTLIGPPLLKSRPPPQAQVSKTMNIRVPDRGLKAAGAA
ncbi:hypothetical protein TNCV_622441 [Trichonephila clavipes]|nr:hypothetical protein TNCV_622441 [Trichonephila clavipes]